MVASIVIANFYFGKDYSDFWHTKIGFEIGGFALNYNIDMFWRHIIGAGFLGGIGFTMSIFITLLAFVNPEIVQSSKISILIGSLVAGTVGFLILNIQTASISNRYV
jgi:NhaA family Na+:H+ antiporter